MAVANIGLGTIAGKHINTFLSELTEEHPGLDAKAMAELLMKEIRTTKPVTDVTLYVADLKTLYVVDLQEDKIDEYTNYGAHWEGVTDIMDRLVGRDIAYKGRTKYVRFKNPPILFDVFNLQSAVNFAVLGIETTYRLMSLQDRVQSVGPPIDVLAITREGARWIAKKEVRV